MIGTISGQARFDAALYRLPHRGQPGTKRLVHLAVDDHADRHRQCGGSGDHLLPDRHRRLAEGSQFLLSGDGFYTLLFYEVDAAGNTETGFPLQLKLDTAAPGAPTAAETAPDRLEPCEPFQRAMGQSHRPERPGRGILPDGHAPSSATDGTFSPLTNRLDGLTVASEGEHAVLSLAARQRGNADQRNRARRRLCATTPPRRPQW